MNAHIHMQIHARSWHKQMGIYNRFSNAFHAMFWTAKPFNQAPTWTLGSAHGFYLANILNVIELKWSVVQIDHVHVRVLLICSFCDVYFCDAVLAFDYVTWIDPFCIVWISFVAKFISNLIPLHNSLCPFQHEREPQNNSDAHVFWP